MLDADSVQRLRLRYKRRQALEAMFGEFAARLVGCREAFEVGCEPARQDHGKGLRGAVGRFRPEAASDSL